MRASLALLAVLLNACSPWDAAESPEPELVVPEAKTYDNVEWHLEGGLPDGVAPEQAYVHAGLYFGWIVERGLHSHWVASEVAEDIWAFLQREMTGPELYAQFAGVLTSAMLNEEGRAFTDHYFRFETERYLADYQELFSELPSTFHVPDTWESYDRVKALVDRRFEAWRAGK